jgi:hypothetical protein
MWWLSFRGGGAAIMNATSLAHARMLSVIANHGRPSTFVEGYLIDPQIAKFLPDRRIGQKLSPAEAEEFRLFLSTNPRKHFSSEPVREAKIEMRDRNRSRAIW